MLLLGQYVLSAVAMYRITVSLSAILRSPSTGLVCHSPEMNWETRKHRITENEINGGDVSDLICASEVRASAERTPLWPEVLDPLARRVKKAAGPVVNVEA